jgi:hypothetical protein
MSGQNGGIQLPTPWQASDTRILAVTSGSRRHGLFQNLRGFRSANMFARRLHQIRQQKISSLSASALNQFQIAIDAEQFGNGIEFLEVGAQIPADNAETNFSDVADRHTQRKQFSTI